MIGRLAFSLTAVFVSVLVSCAQVPEREIRGGRLYVKGEWVFLKVAKPLHNFALKDDCERLIANLPTLQKKDYNCIEINCYWHHFDKDGDGSLDVDMAPLRRLFDAVHARDMFPCLSIETYGVGGGQIPESFWAKNPDSHAINSEGKRLVDTEYGFGTKVPSIFSPGYQTASRCFIREVTEALDHRKILWFETTVEPQYIGNQALDFSSHAREAYEEWASTEQLQAPAWPDKFPASESFVKNPVWNRFRAEALADWVNGDAAAFRSVAGKDAYVAVDYLETAAPDMMFRNGDSIAFLMQLDSANVIQVNWHWHLGLRNTNEVAYRNVRQVMQRTGRDWAIMEHMTLNGSDFKPAEVADLLRSTLRNGTCLGWEFVDTAPHSTNSFCHYNDDWTPKPLIAEVDNRWEEWVEEIRAEAESGQYLKDCL